VEIYLHRHHRHESVARKLADQTPECEIHLPLADEIHRQIKPDQKQKSPHIMEEMPNVIPLISDRRGQILRPVPFDVVMLDMVIVVRVPGVTNQRLKDIRKHEIHRRHERSLGFRQHPVVVDVIVQHQRKGPRAPEGKGHVGDGVEVGEVSEEEDRRGQIDERIHEDVGEEDDVRGVADDFHGEGGVRSEDVFLDQGVDVLGVPEGENLDFGFGLVGVILARRVIFVWIVPSE
jgi:hypothetical protein